MPDSFLGTWMAEQGFRVHSIDVHKDRIVVVADSGETQTCMIRQVQVKSSWIGKETTTTVSCEPIPRSKAKLYQCGRSLQLVVGDLRFVQPDVNFTQNVTVLDDNFLQCEFTGDRLPALSPPASAT